MRQYHDDEDVSDVESGSPGGVRTARECRMDAVLGVVALVELGHAATERVHLSQSNIARPWFVTAPA